MDSLQGKRLERLHSQFLDGAECFHDLCFAAVTQRPDAGLLQPSWPCVLRRDGDQQLGLTADEWRDALQKQPREICTPLANCWLQLSDQLWQGAFYNGGTWGDESQLQPQHQRFMAGIDEFCGLARHAAGHVLSGPTVWGPDHPLRNDAADRWLEFVCSMDFVEFDGRFAFLIKRVPGDIFMASARSLEFLMDPAKCAYAISGEGPLMLMAEQGGSQRRLPTDDAGKPLINSAGDPFTHSPGKIWSIEDYYRAKEFCDKHGTVFNPALERGSPAANHVIAQHYYEATAPEATCFGDVCGGLEVKRDNADTELRRSYNSIIVACDSTGGDQKDAMRKIRAKVCQYHGIDVAEANVMPLSQFVALLEAAERYLSEGANESGSALLSPPDPAFKNYSLVRAAGNIGHETKRIDSPRSPSNGLRRLRQIPAELLALSTATYAPTVFATTAGDLLWEAYELGAFERHNPAFDKLRVFMRTQYVNFANSGPDGPSWRIGAYDEAVICLAPQYHDNNEWQKALSAIAHTIEEEIAWIESHEEGNGPRLRRPFSIDAGCDIAWAGHRFLFGHRCCRKAKSPRKRSGRR